MRSKCCLIGALQRRHADRSEFSLNKTDFKELVVHQDSVDFDRLKAYKVDCYETTIGVCNKLRINCDNGDYLMKFSNCKNDAYADTEYISSTVIRHFGFNTHKTFLRKLEGIDLNGNEFSGHACFCSWFNDFETYQSVIQEMGFTSVGYSLKNVDRFLNLVARKSPVPTKVVNDLYDLTIIDCLLLNRDRSSYNLGLTYVPTEEGRELRLVHYDNALSLMGGFTDSELIRMVHTDNLKRNIMCQNTTFTDSMLSNTGDIIGRRQLTYKQLFDLGDSKLDDALIRMFPKIDLDWIINFISNIEILSDLRKQVAIDVIKHQYYEVLKPRYKCLIKQRGLI